MRVEVGYLVGVVGDVAEAVEDVQAGSQESRPVRDVLVSEEGGAVSGGEEGGQVRDCRCAVVEGGLVGVGWLRGWCG